MGVRVISRQVRRIGFLLVVILLSFLSPARIMAQDSTGHVRSTPQFMPRYDFGLSITHVVSPDPRFSWDGVIDADFDVIDYTKGRTSLLAQYDVVMGNQLRPFDPNQGDYTFEITSSLRIHKTEVAGLFHHLSRHLSDRPNAESVAYNAMGVRLLHNFALSRMTVNVREDFAGVIRRNFLDYAWTNDLDISTRRPISKSIQLFSTADIATSGIVHSVAERPDQKGLRFENGVHLKGENGSIELFAGWEKRVDAYPLDRMPQRWVLAGFRIQSR